MTDLFDYAERQARAGMKRAAENAPAGWPALAYAFLVRFAREHETFISEDVSAASKRAGLVQPPTDRAWGSIYRRAAKAGVIRQDGTGRSSRRHASICPRWRSLVFKPLQRSA